LKFPAIAFYAGQALTQALTERLQVLEAQKDVTLSADKQP
jgi:hypothetical protein